jgi:hypothetical protein
VKRQPRKYCEPVRQLDIRVFQRKGLLDAGGSIVVRWQIGGSMRVELSPHRARVVYQLDGRLVEQLVNIGDTANGYGRRGWWGCPGCGRLCAKLYLHDRFLCRRCAGLHYESQSAAPRRRALIRFQKIRSRLVDEFGELRRPKWMRHTKFAALLGEAERLEGLLAP